MKTFSLTIVHTRTDARNTLQVIEYRGILITRQFSTDGDYAVTVEWHTEECDFNSLIDALNWVEDELNREDSRRYYRTQADLTREWSSLGR